MITRKAVAFGTAGGLLIAGGLFFLDMQAVLTGALLLVFLLLAASVSAPHLKVTRSVPEGRLIEKDWVPVRLRVKNRSTETGPVLEVTDTVSDRLLLPYAGNRSFLNLGPREAATLAYDVHAPLRGVHDLGPLRVRVHDPTGFTLRDLATDGTTELTVYPALENLPEQLTASRRFSLTAGGHRAWNIGASTEFRGMRDYAPGDAFRRINWKATVRHQHLIVNEYEHESVCDVLLVVDARAVNATGTARKNPLEACIRAAAALAHHFLHRRMQVGCIAYGGETRVIAPASGPRQEEKILALLVALPAAGERAMANGVETALAHLGPESRVIILSSLEDDPTVASAILRLRARSGQVSVVSPSVVAFETEAAGSPTARGDAALLARSNVVADLRAMGVDVLEVPPDESPKWILERVAYRGGVP